MDRASESIKRSIKEALRRRRKENQHFNDSGPRATGGISLAACVVLDGTTLPNVKISRVLRAQERVSQKRLDDFCELV
jgi:hypothetical protein